MSTLRSHQNKSTHQSVEEEMQKTGIQSIDKFFNYG